jgi:CRP-like cAMP-binding protein
MNYSAQQALQTLITKLESDSTLGEEERAALLRLPVHIRQHKAGEDIVRERDVSGQCCLLVAGWLYRYKSVGSGKRQILSFHVAGEMPDLQSLHLRVMDHTLAALSAATVAMIAHTELRHLTERHPRVASLLWRETLIDAAIFREWMTNLGRREALAHAAHLACEMYVRLEAVGLAREHRFHFPVTQENLADALGNTGVHVNRTLQSLRASGLLVWQNREVAIPDWNKLVEVAGFDPTYLHMKTPR